MKLGIFTIVLDGMPYIMRHLDEFQKLKCDWEWHIVEGAADNTKDTSWCQKQEFRLSKDGTTEYLRSLIDPRVSHSARPRWENKTSMVNHALREMVKPDVLMQIDVDEMWTAEQLDTIVKTFSRSPQLGKMQFYCNYFLGPDIIAFGSDCYGNNPGEWQRAWRFKNGCHFERHEPPILRGCSSVSMNRAQTRTLGLVFNHYAYATEKQVAYKERFYGYSGAVEGWNRLQANEKWPVKLKDYLPWVDDRASAIKI